MLLFRNLNFYSFHFVGTRFITKILIFSHLSFSFSTTKTPSSSSNNTVVSNSVVSKPRRNMQQNLSPAAAIIAQNGGKTIPLDSSMNKSPITSNSSNQMIPITQNQIPINPNNNNNHNNIETNGRAEIAQDSFNRQHSSLSISQNLNLKNIPSVSNLHDYELNNTLEHLNNFPMNNNLSISKNNINKQPRHPDYMTVSMMKKGPAPFVTAESQQQPLFVAGSSGGGQQSSSSFTKFSNFNDMPLENSQNLGNFHQTSSNEASINGSLKNNNHNHNPLINTQNYSTLPLRLPTQPQIPATNRSFSTNNPGNTSHIHNNIDPSKFSINNDYNGYNNHDLRIKSLDLDMKLLEIEQLKLENDKKLIEMARRREMMIVESARLRRENLMKKQELEQMQIRAKNNNLNLKNNNGMARSDSGTSLVSIATSLNCEHQVLDSNTNVSKIYKGTTLEGRNLYEIISSKIIEVDENQIHNNDHNQSQNQSHNHNQNTINQNLPNSIHHSAANSNIIPTFNNDRRRSSGVGSNGPVGSIQNNNKHQNNNNAVPTLLPPQNQPSLPNNHNTNNKFIATQNNIQNQPVCELNGVLYRIVGYQPDGLPILSRQ